MFHLLKVFVSDTSVSSLQLFSSASVFRLPPEALEHTKHSYYVAPPAVFPDIQIEEEAFEANQCQNDAAEGERCTPRDSLTGTSYFCSASEHRPAWQLVSPVTRIYEGCFSYCCALVP